MVVIPPHTSSPLTLPSSRDMMRSVHPAAYCVKMIARSMSLLNVTESLVARLNELAKESDQVTGIVHRHPFMNKTGKIWRQRLKSNSRELKRVREGIMITRDLLVLESEHNATIVLARTLLGRIPPRSTTDDLFDSERGHIEMDSLRNDDDENETQRKRWTDVLNVAKLNNYLITSDIKKSLLGAADLAKQLVQNDYYTCSKCQTMYWKFYKEAFGVLAHIDHTDETTPVQFFCSCCSRHLEQPYPTPENEVRGQSSCVADKASPPRAVGRKESMSHDIPVKLLPGDRTTQPLNVTLVHDVQAPVQTVANGGPVVASNEDWVEYLLRTGSIIALNEYMDELLGES
jgi:hypothetical protein